MRAHLRSHGLASQEDPATGVGHFEMRVRLSLDPEGDPLDVDATQRDLALALERAFQHWLTAKTWRVSEIERNHSSHISIKEQ
jgi:hypothetical protein